MGEIRDDDEDALATWESMVDFASRYERYHDLAAKMIAGGPPPSGRSPLLDSALIIDTDVGGDPDDALALVVASLRVPQLALVITTDEFGGQRARFARYLLDLAGRPDVPVVVGADLGNTRYYCVEGLVPDSVPAQPTDFVAAVVRLMTANEGPVRWLGIGPLTNLAVLLAAHPEYADRLYVTQMGGALAYRDPTRAEHNVRLDATAAVEMITTLPHLTLVSSDVTFNPAMEIIADSALARSLADPGAPAWAGLLTAHMSRWFERFHPGTMQHDPLTLAVALGHSFADLTVIPAAIAADGRMAPAPDGIPLKFARSVEYDGFMWWLGKQLEWNEPAVTGGDSHEH